MTSHNIDGDTFQPPKYAVGDKVWVEAELIATPPPCKHIVGTEIPPTATNPEFQWFDYTYCPLCGEEL